MTREELEKIKEEKGRVSILRDGFRKVVIDFSKDNTKINDDYLIKITKINSKFYPLSSVVKPRPYNKNATKTKSFKNCTLCWDCQNFATCKWATEFKPIEGWDATPTKIKNNMIKGGQQYTDSYLVHKCPEFISDWRVISYENIAKIIEIPEKTLRRNRTWEWACNEMLKKGYLIKRYEINTQYIYYYKKVENKDDVH